MVSAFEMLHNNRDLQIHWVKRIFAFIFDFIILSIPIAVASIFLGIDILRPISILSFSIIFVLYSFILEAWLGATIGKKLLGLEVASVDGTVIWKKALVRNIPRFMGVVFIDWMLGLVTEGDPRQRFMDRIAVTTVLELGSQKLSRPYYITKMSLFKGKSPLVSTCNVCGSAMIEDVEGKHCPKCKLKKFLGNV